MIYVSHLLSDEEMKRILEVKDVGIESIEFSVGYNLDRLSETVEAYQKRMEKMGVRHLTLHGPFLDLNPASYDSEVQKITRLRFEQCYEAAVRLKAQKIVYHSCFIPTVHFEEGWPEHMAEFYRDFMEKKDGVEVVVENLLDRRWKPLKNVVESINNPNVHVCLDIGHAHCYSGLAVEDWAENLKDRISHVHVHDNFGKKDEHLELGKGSLPVGKVLEILKDIRCSYTIECSTGEAVLGSLAVLEQHGIMP